VDEHPGERLRRVSAFSVSSAICPDASLPVIEGSCFICASHPTFVTRVRQRVLRRIRRNSGFSVCWRMSVPSDVITGVRRRLDEKRFHAESSSFRTGWSFACDGSQTGA
jgi:hypothetical protein